MSHVLVLSAHETQLDRRIVSEANALAQSGREVTLVSVPTRMETSGLDSRVRMVVEQEDTFESTSPARSVARHLPEFLKGIAKSLWYLFGSGPAPYNTAYFLRHTPAERFDAIHCHDLKTLPAGVGIRRRQCPGAKLIYDAHEFFPFQTSNRCFQHYWKRIERQAIVETDLTITVNESIAEAMAKLYGIARPGVLYNSCERIPGEQDLSEEEFLAHFGAPPSPARSVLFQGSLSTDRNLRALVRAFAKLEGRARLFLLGEGVRDEELRRICAQERIRNVFFGPWVAQERLLGFVRRANMGVIPYLGHVFLNSLYCTPNKLFEFIEAGVPICASDLPELRRIVRGHGIGDVYAMDSPRLISEALSDCLSRLEMGEFSAKTLAAAREKFSWRRQAENMLRWYEQLGV